MTDSPLREAIARIVDPASWKYADHSAGEYARIYVRERIAPSLTKADAIIALPEIAELRAQLQACREALEPFAHIASRFDEWGIRNEETVLLIEERDDVLTEIFARPFIRALAALPAKPED